MRKLGFSAKSLGWLRCFAEYKLAHQDKNDEASRAVETALDEERWQGIRSCLGLPDEVQPSLLSQAFCHASFTREAGLGPAACNQRLEFLGDAVLDLILVQHLYTRHSDTPEGQLTKMKATAVRAHTLARIARELGLGEHLLLGHGEEETGGRQKPSLLADCFEALVGAVYLSTDLRTTEEFILDRFSEVLREIEARQAIFDYKTTLQELLQERTKQTPSYRTAKTLGPPHQRTFVVEVRFNGAVIGCGEGSSKQAGQQAAAQDALDQRNAWLAQLPHC